METSVLLLKVFEVLFKSNIMGPGSMVVSIKK